MAKAKCPNCGTEYDTSGIATICSHCLKPLPVAPTARPSTPATATPSSQRRPCVKCGELLYPTEVTCWKCGSPQSVRPPTYAAPPPPGTHPPPPPTPTPPPMAPTPPPYPYPAGGYVSGPSPEAQSRATTALILGVVGLLCCNLLGPVALALGLSAKREGAEGTATAAIIVGAIGTAFLVLGILWAILVGLAGVTGSTGAPTP